MENKRRILLINKRFQYGLILKFVLINILVLSLYGGVLYLLLDNEIQSNLYVAHVTYKNMKEMLLPIVVTLSVLNIVVSSVLIGVFVLFASHRIAGPLYRFKTVVHEICQRNLQPFLSLRKKDELFPLLDTLKEMIDLLQADGEKVNEIQKQLKEINQELNNDDLAAEITKLEAIIRLYQT